MPILGVLGGLGPLASAEFLRALYRHHALASEQEMPRCILISDPTFPDRTQAILEGRTDELVPPLSAALSSLVGQGADTLLIACVTVHTVLDRLAPELRRRVVSLIDLVLAEQAARPEPRLLLTTSGTRAARIFERNPRWPGVAPSVLYLDESDQEEIHRRIYRLKRGEEPEACLDWLREIASRYPVRGFIFGCTELHLLQRLIPPGEAIDPLSIAIRDLHELAPSRPE